MAGEVLSRDLYGDNKDKAIDKLSLEETNAALGALEDYCKKLNMRTEEDQKDLDALRAHVKAIEGGSTQSSTEKSKFEAMDVSAATDYLKGLKDKSWSEVSKEDSKRVGAVQVVLKDKGYDVGEIDGVLGKSKSKTRAAVRKFQIASGFKGKNIDGVPGPITIKAIFGEKVSDAAKSGSSEKLTEGQEDKVTNWTRSGVDGSFTGTTKVKSGEQQPWNGEFTLKDGSKVEIKDGNIQS